MEPAVARGGRARPGQRVAVIWCGLRGPEGRWWPVQAGEPSDG